MAQAPNPPMASSRHVSSFEALMHRQSTWDVTWNQRCDQTESQRDLPADELDEILAQMHPSLPSSLVKQLSTDEYWAKVRESNAANSDDDVIGAHETLGAPPAPKSAEDADAPSPTCSRPSLSQPDPKEEMKRKEMRARGRSTHFNNNNEVTEADATPGPSYVAPYDSDDFGDYSEQKCANQQRLQPVLPPPPPRRTPPSLPAQFVLIDKEDGVVAHGSDGKVQLLRTSSDVCITYEWSAKQHKHKRVWRFKNKAVDDDDDDAKVDDQLLMLEVYDALTNHHHILALHFKNKELCSDFSGAIDGVIEAIEDVRRRNAKKTTFAYAVSQIVNSTPVHVSSWVLRTLLMVAEGVQRGGDERCRKQPMWPFMEIKGVLDFMKLLGFQPDAKGLHLICASSPSRDVVNDAMTAIFRSSIQFIAATNTNADAFNARQLLRQELVAAFYTYNVPHRLDTHKEEYQELIGYNGAGDFLYLVGFDTTQPGKWLRCLGSSQVLTNAGEAIDRYNARTGRFAHAVSQIVKCDTNAFEVLGAMLRCADLVKFGNLDLLKSRVRRFAERVVHFESRVDGVLEFLHLLGYNDYDSDKTRDQLVCEETPSDEAVKEAIAAVFQGGVQIVKARNADTNANTLHALKQLRVVCNSMLKTKFREVEIKAWRSGRLKWLAVDGVRDFLHNLLNFETNAAGATFCDTIPTRKVLDIAMTALSQQMKHDALGNSQKQMEVRSMTPMELLAIGGQVLTGGRGRAKAMKKGK